VKYAWIASNKAHWPITLACDVLGVSASGYFEHEQRESPDKPGKAGTTFKRMNDNALLTHIRAIHAEVKGKCGWRKMSKERVARGQRVGKDRVR
jgi:putative transposase